jgi:ketosteroid isomerase-like protein
MTTQTPATRTDADIARVRAGFEAVANRDLAAFADLFHADATWNHRNDDRLGGVHHGSDGIVAFIAESMQLTGGTLRPVAHTLMADGHGRVVALMRVSGTRPDGRSFDDPQVLVFTLDGDRVRSVDQYIGDPTAVTAFWA